MRIRLPWLGLPTALLVLLSTAAEAQVPSEAQVELVGDSLVWDDTHAVYETTEDSKFQTERYGADFHVRVRGLPAGTYGLRLGLVEMKFDNLGERVFSLAANGRPLLDRFDILTQAGRYEALVKAFRIDLTGPVLDLHFTAQQDNAKFCFIRIYNDELVTEIHPRIPVGQIDRADQPDAPYMAGMYETSIGRFGSRVAFNPRPRSRSWWQGALGHADYAVAHFEKEPRRWEDYPYDIAIGTESHGAEPVAYALPFTESVASFPHVAQAITPTSLAYTCRAPDLPYEVEFGFVAPFYPQDVKLSTAPYIRLDVTARDAAGQGAKGEVFVSQAAHGDATVAALWADGLVGWVHSLTQFGKATQQIWCTRADTDVRRLDGGLRLAAHSSVAASTDLDRDGDGRTIVPVTLWQPMKGLAWEFDLPPGGAARNSFVFVGWCAEPVLRTVDRDLSFKYLEFFDSPEDVVRYAYDEREAADRRSALFEGTALGVEGLPDSYADLFSFAFQSYAMNTWYMSDAAGDWYSCWEGCCKFHSTVDVEYNQWPFYLHYWPELARLTLDAWADHEQDGIMPHDMGMGLEIGEMKYPHHMEVEEGTNFVLLLFAYWRATGDMETVTRHLDVAARLMDFIEECDTDGDGFADRGTSNTIDQGSRAIQHAPEQVYLAGKSLGAATALSAMAAAAGDDALGKVNSKRAALVAETLRGEAWLDDHYAVALEPGPRPQPAGDTGGWNDQDRYAGDGMGGPGAGRGWDDGGSYYSEPEPVSGWDGHSIYAGNGLLYSFAHGLPVDADLGKLRQDMIASTEATLKRLGSPHTDQEGNTWASQNIWRDMVAAYIGLDLLDNVERYWDFEVQQNRLKRGCFTDVYNYGSGSTSLDYYPRGIVVAGLPSAAAGMSLDRAASRLSFAPIRVPLRIPLTALADWGAERVPWAQFSVVDGEIQLALGDDSLVRELAPGIRPQGQPYAALSAADEG